MDSKPDSGSGKKKKSETEVKCSTNTKTEEFVEGSGVSKDEIQVGYKLMAASFDGKWYQGRIVEVDENDSTFLVHFDFWNSRFDEWYKFTTKKVKPMEDEPRRRNRLTPSFKLGDAVIAKWVDGRLYRGKIHQAKSSDMYDVMFEDGVIFSTSVKSLKFGDKLDATIEDERLVRKEELSKRSKEREFRSHRRSLGPGSVPRLLTMNFEWDSNKPSLTAVQHLNNLPLSLSLGVSFPLSKLSLSFQFEQSKSICTLQGETYNVPSLTHVFGNNFTKQKSTTATTTSSRESSPEIDIPESSQRKRGRPKLHSPPAAQLTPSKRTKPDTVESSCSPSSKSPPKKVIPKKHVLKNVSLSSSPGLKTPVKQSPATRTASVQTDPIEELLVENKAPLPTAVANTPTRVEQPTQRPLYPLPPPVPPPVPPQQVPSLLQTETVLTSDGRWITIATTPAPAQQPLQIPPDVTQRPPTAPNVYYQLVPMGANGPIHAPTVAPPIHQPQDPLQSLQQSHLVLAQPAHNPLMVLPQTRPLLQQSSSPYLHQARPLLQYQAASSTVLQPQAANTVLVHANTLAPLMLPQTALVAPINPPTQDIVPGPQIAQRQIDPPSTMILSTSSPLLTSPPASNTLAAIPPPPVTSNLVASRATIRLPEVQATVPLIGQFENGENPSIISLSSRLPFSSLLSNTTQPSPSLPTTSHLTASLQSGEVAIATIFAPLPSDPSPATVSITQAPQTSQGPTSPVDPSKPRSNQPQAPSLIETNTKFNSQSLHANEESQELNRIAESS